MWVLALIGSWLGRGSNWVFGSYWLELGRGSNWVLNRSWLSLGRGSNWVLDRSWLHLGLGSIWVLAPFGSWLFLESHFLCFARPVIDDHCRMTENILYSSVIHFWVEGLVRGLWQSWASFQLKWPLCLFHAKGLPYLIFNVLDNFLLHRTEVIFWYQLLVSVVKEDKQKIVVLMGKCANTPIYTYCIVNWF